ncbi:MAG: DUF1700 domain-containing protein [Oscillospiraceae bacterium]|jgi:uncharacterized membrane protein|nr:DUF1700 domain-containing protein [Oscillospiraceae bacterium]
MNRELFLDALGDALCAGGVPDADEIVAEYAEHFARKAADGFTEEETAARLGDPKAIAAQFDVWTPPRPRAARAALAAGLVCTDIVVGTGVVLRFAGCVVFGGAAAASVAAGTALLLHPVLPQIPLVPAYIPALGGTALGLSLLALGCVFAALTAYCYAFASNTARAYRRWHRNTWRGVRYPPVSIHPLLRAPLRRRLRGFATVSLAAFAGFLTLGYAALALAARHFEFWHVWQWFD